VSERRLFKSSEVAQIFIRALLVLRKRQGLGGMQAVGKRTWARRSQVECRKQLLVAAPANKLRTCEKFFRLHISNSARTVKSLGSRNLRQAYASVPHTPRKERSMTGRVGRETLANSHPYHKSITLSSPVLTQVLIMATNISLPTPHPVNGLGLRLKPSRNDSKLQLFGPQSMVSW